MNSIAPAEPQALRAWVMFQLRLRGLSFAEVGRRHGVSRQAVRLAFAQKYPRMERAIAEAIEVRPEELWPDRWEKRSKK